MGCCAACRCRDVCTDTAAGCVSLHNGMWHSSCNHWSIEARRCDCAVCGSSKTGMSAAAKRVAAACRAVLWSLCRAVLCCAVVVCPLTCHASTLVAALGAKPSPKPTCDPRNNRRQVMMVEVSEAMGDIMGIYWGWNATAVAVTVSHH
jgi:hypothetical protein